LVLSRAFACRIASAPDAPSAASALWHGGRSAVIVTCGADGCWYTDGGTARHFPAVPVRARDTSGCGDVFHGVYAAWLARGLPLEERTRAATEAAGYKAAEGEINP